GRSSPAPPVLCNAPTPYHPSRRTSLAFVWRYHSGAPVFVPPTASDADAGPGAFGFGSSAPTAGGDGRVSQVPGKPLCAYALFSDPGRTGHTRPYGAPTWPPLAARRRLPARR